VYAASKPHVGVLGRVPGVPGAYGDIERHPDYTRIPDLLVVRLEGPLFYANATLVRDRIKQLVGTSDPLPQAVVIEVSANDGLDITSAEMLEQLARTLHAAQIDVALADLRQPVVAMAARTGLLVAVGDDRVFHTVDEAVQSLTASTHTVRTDRGPHV
jgi:SulP family sulfate permease